MFEKDIHDRHVSWGGPESKSNIPAIIHSFNTYPSLLPIGWHDVLFVSENLPGHSPLRLEAIQLKQQVHQTALKFCAARHPMPCGIDAISMSTGG